MSKHWKAIASAGKALLSPITSLWGGRQNRRAQTAQNQADRDHERGMYDLQRADALTDWAAQNAYNSPEQQMERLRQAGLNPNLIYGKGAENTATSVRSSTPSASSKPPKKYDELQNVGSQFWQSMAAESGLKLNQAQTDNLYAGTEVKHKEKHLKDAQTLNTLAQTDQTEFQTIQNKEAKDLIIKQIKLDNQQAEQNIIGKKTEIKISLERNEREKLTASTNVAKTLAEILRTKAQTKQITQVMENLLTQSNANTVIAKANAELRKEGVSINDPLYLRMLIMKLQKIMDWGKTTKPDTKPSKRPKLETTIWPPQ